jgi:3-phosphoshikimate 1-carboxyvinyltransferase
MVSVPGDKSISHRAVMLAAIADGPSRINGWLPAGDTLATLEAIRVLGPAVEMEPLSSQAWNLIIYGRGMTGLQAPAGPLNCHNAGTCMRLMAGLLAGQPFATTLDGSEQLRRRPMGRITQPLRLMGADITDHDGRAPLQIRPAQLTGIDYHLPVASAQVKSALLLAGLYARGTTRITEPGPTRDHTERMLRAMGVPVETSGRQISLAPAEKPLEPLDLHVPGDFSSAAFLIVAAMIVPQAEITLTATGINDTRTGLLDVLSGMGGQVRLDRRSQTGGEPVVDLTASFSELHGIEVGGETVVRTIDEIPIWAVAATQAAGQSTIQDAAELRVKEVDRISLLAAELRKMGGQISEQPDGFTVTGPTRLAGAAVDSHGDHRLGMALAVAGLAAVGPTGILNAGCIADSFPGFVPTMQLLGADMNWIDESPQAGS